MVLVNIKWNKQTFENIDLDPSAGAVGFKSLVARLTGVPNDRQKLMAKGCWSGTLKDDVDFGAISFKPGQQIVLMGTADVVIAPQETIKFVEDMTDNQKAEIGIVISAGLNNLQNTCYMNSTVQCLRFMPELRSVIRDVTPTSADLPATELTVALKNTFDRLDSSAVSISPVEFVLRLRGHFPQFAERYNFFLHLFFTAGIIYVKAFF